MESTVSTAPALRPWRLSSLFWVAFFGGPLAMAVMAFLNAQRLQDERTARLGLGLGFAAVLVGLVASTLLISSGAPRWVDRAVLFTIALALYFATRHLQAPVERAYTFRNGEVFASALLPGIGAVVGAAIVATGLKSLLLLLLSA